MSAPAPRTADGRAQWVASFEALSLRFAALVFMELRQYELADAYIAEADRVEALALGLEVH